MFARIVEPLVGSSTIILGLWACAPTVTSRMSAATAQSPRPESAMVRLYDDSSPRCLYERIGTVSAHQQLASMDVVFDSIRGRARQMGGDAVIEVRKKLVVTGTARSRNGQVTLLKDTVISGTVIRFRDASCLE